MIDKIKALVRDVHNFPKPGILFKDITPILAAPWARKAIIDMLANSALEERVSAVAAIESRGFLFGLPLADALGVPFIPIRKEGKLPFETLKHAFKLEYGEAVIEMHRDAIVPGTRVLIHDDVLATGGTAIAAAELLLAAGGVIAGFSFVLNLGFLPGQQNIKARFGVEAKSVITY